MSWAITGSKLLAPSGGYTKVQRCQNYAMQPIKATSIDSLFFGMETWILATANGYFMAKNAK